LRSSSDETRDVFPKLKQSPSPSPQKPRKSTSPQKQSRKRASPSKSSSRSRMALLGGTGDDAEFMGAAELHSLVQMEFFSDPPSSPGALLRSTASSTTRPSSVQLPAI
jgi:hypothetical protein